MSTGLERNDGSCAFGYSWAIRFESGVAHETCGVWVEVVSGVAGWGCGSGADYAAYRDIVGGCAYTGPDARPASGLFADGGGFCVDG